LRAVFAFRKENVLLEIHDTLLIGALAPPEGGRNNITPRFVRHFNVLSIESFQEDLMRSIFLPVLTWHFNNSGFSAEYTKYLHVLSHIYIFIDEIHFLKRENFNYKLNFFSDDH
jgi:hypothetical protein